MQNNDIFIDSTGNRSSFVNIYWFNVSVYFCLEEISCACNVMCGCGCVFLHFLSHKLGQCELLKRLAILGRL